MPTYVDTLPQKVELIRTVTLRELIGCLPSVLIFPLNVWIGDRMARYGMTTGNIVFLIENEEDATEAVRKYFSSLTAALGIQATAMCSWKNNAISALRLYNEGRLIIDKSTLAYKEIPTPTRCVPVLTIAELIAKLPRTIKWNHTLWLTGGIVKNGWSANDADLIIFEEQTDRSVFVEIARFFTVLLGWKTDVGGKVMEDREPVYLFKLYERGALCLP